MKIFLTGPMTKLQDPITHEFSEKHIKRIKRMISFLEAKGHEIKNAHKDEEFGRNMPSFSVMVKRDYDAIEWCDLLFAYPISRGVCVEVGYAHALRKKIILLIREGKYFTPMIRGMEQYDNIEIIRFSDEEDLYPKLERFV